MSENTEDRVLKLQDRLTWPGIAKLAVGGATGVLGWTMYVKSDLWFPRLLESPVALAILVGCAGVAAYAASQARLLTLVDAKTMQMQNMFSTETTNLRAELAESRRSERSCAESLAAVRERLAALEAVK